MSPSRCGLLAPLRKEPELSTSNTVIVVSSHVARGAVGSRAMVFVLERLGFTVWAVPTVILPHHPGHGPAERIIADDKAFAGLLDALVKDERAGQVAAIVSGYLGTPGQAHAVAGLVDRVKAARPEALYLADPVIGDGGRLYVTEALADAVRDALLPRADAATPNAFECAWLAGHDGSAAHDLPRLAASLAPRTVLVTSAPALMRGSVANLLVGPAGPLMLEHPLVDTPLKGTGDLLAALLLGRRLAGGDWAEAAAMALASVFEVVAGSARAGADELMLPALQDALVSPRARIATRRLPPGALS